MKGILIIIAFIGLIVAGSYVSGYENKRDEMIYDKEKAHGL